MVSGPRACFGRIQQDRVRLDCGDVAGDRRGLAAPAANGLRHGLQFLRRGDVGHGHIEARIREGQRDGLADAPAGTRNKC